MVTATDSEIELNDSLDRLGEKIVRLRDAADKLRTHLDYIREEVREHEDVRDGSDGRPQPNAWMSLGILIDAACDAYDRARHLDGGR